MRKCFFAAILAASMFIPTISIHAEEINTYQKISEQYGERSESYITTIGETGINSIFCNGINATVGQSTNVREFPNAESNKVTTIDQQASVKIWGFTDNGWCNVFCKDVNGVLHIGYIRSDLLAFDFS